MGKLRLTAVSEIVFNSCVTQQLLRRYDIELGTSIIKMYFGKCQEKLKKTFLWGF